MAKQTPQSLTDMQQAFVANYLITLNAKKAAIAAGYAPANADAQGYQLLQHPTVSKQLRQAMARRAKRLELNADNVLKEIARIAFSDIRSVTGWTSGTVTVRPSDTVHSDAAAAIQSIEQHTSETEKSSNTTIKVKMHDKLRALELAGRHLGLWAKGDDDAFKSMTLADLIVLVKQKIPELEGAK